MTPDNSIPMEAPGLPAAPARPSHTPHAAGPVLSSMILTETEAARTLRLSIRTLQRMRIEGGGPAFIQLSERRIGYAAAALEAWITARQVASTSAATVAKRGAA